MPKKSKTPVKKSESNGKTLTAAQIRILKVLGNSQSPLNRQMISEQAGVPKTHVTGFVFKRYKTKKTDSLVEQKLVKAEILGAEDGIKERCYEITPAGRKTLEKLA